jgi:hypothetical protein
MSPKEMETEMPTLKPFIAVCAAAMLLAAPAGAQDASPVAKDVFESGVNATIDRPADRDAFVSGFSVSVESEVGKDAHAAGFNVTADAPIRGDLYAVGATVNIESPVGEDVTASGFSVRLRRDAEVGGNARLSGASVVVDGPVRGNLTAVAGSLEIDAEIAGDAFLSAGTLEFGSDARVGGILTYKAPARIDIPETVASPDRVRFERLSIPDSAKDLAESARDSMPSFWPSFFGMVAGFIITLMFLVAVAALLLAFAPRTMETWRRRAADKMWVSILFGGTGLAFLIGLVPVSALTVIGAPLIPIVIFGVLTVWMVGYLVGAYALGWRVTAGFREVPETTAGRLILIALTLVVLAVLNFVPLLGWLLNFAVVLLGVGALTMMAGERVFCSATPDSDKAQGAIADEIVESGKAPSADKTAKPGRSKTS